MVDKLIIDPPHTRMKVLVVDDTEINLNICRRALAPDYEVFTAKSGEEGLRVAAETAPDLILLDIMMPGMSGYETFEALRSRDIAGNTPVIFVTALTDVDSQHQALSMGAVDYITKPFYLSILRHRVRNILEREQLRREAEHKKHAVELLLDKAHALANTLESAFDATSDALIITSDAFQVIKTNIHAERLFQPLGELQGKYLSRLDFRTFSGEFLDIAPLIDRDSAQECTVSLDDQHFLQLSLTVRSFMGAGGETHLLLSFQDIAHRLELEEATRRSAEILHETVIELTKQKCAMDEHALVSITNAHGLMTYANEKFCARSGYSATELLGQGYHLLKSDLHPQSFFEELWRTIRAGQTWHGQIANRNRNGQIYWLESTIIPWVDEYGTPYQYVAIHTEVTERVQAEEHLRQAHQREIEAAAIIQQRLLFGAPPSNLPGLDIASYTEATKGIDGDFYAFTHVGEDVIEIITGDVMGKGILAAMIGAGLKSTYRKLVSQAVIDNRGEYPSAAWIVNRLHEDISPELIDLNTFVTLSLLRVDRKAMTVTWVNAGHTPVLMLSHETGSIRKLTSDNLPIGIIATEVYEEFSAPVAIGDTLLSYSDGISEATDPQGEFYGEERINLLLHQGRIHQASAAILMHSLWSDVHNHVQNDHSQDDRTAIIVQVRPVRGKVRGTIKDRRAPEYLSLERKLNRLELLRKRIAVLAQDQPEARTHELILAAFEAATNIVRHTPKKLQDAKFFAVLRRDESELSVELIYAGLPFIPKGTPQPDFSGNSEGGFGLFIIENSVDQVIYDEPMPGLARIMMIKELVQADAPALH